MAGYGADQAFSDWMEANGYTLPEGAPDAAVLRERGSVYIDGTYGDRFPGKPTGGASQERAWPRTGASDRYGNALPTDQVPQRVIDASYHAAWMEATTPGILSKTYTPAEQKVLVQVQTIRWQVTGDAKSDRAMVAVSTVIEGILSPLLVADDLPAILVV